MHIEPEAPRFVIETTADGMRAIVPARRNWFVLLFMCAWLVGWMFGEVSALRQLVSPTDDTPQPFVIAWLVGWTIGGAIAAATILWQLAGRELVFVNSSTLTHRVEAFGLGVSRSYKASEVRNLRITSSVLSPFGNQAAFFPPVFGPGFGPVAFDYGARTLRLGATLEEAEAKILVDRLSPKLPRRPETR